MQVDDEPLLVVGEEAPLEVGPQVVGPPQPAALPAPQQPCSSSSHARTNHTSTRRQGQGWSAGAGAATGAAKHRRPVAVTTTCIYTWWIAGKFSHSPASLGTTRQQQWPWVRRKPTSFWSSSAVHGPFFMPTLSQHGCLPISQARDGRCGLPVSVPGKLGAVPGSGIYRGRAW